MGKTRQGFGAALEPMWNQCGARACKKKPPVVSKKCPVPTHTCRAVGVAPAGSTDARSHPRRLPVVVHDADGILSRNLTDGGAHTVVGAAVGARDWRRGGNEPKMENMQLGKKQNKNEAEPTNKPKRACWRPWRDCTLLTLAPSEARKADALPCGGVARALTRAHSLLLVHLAIRPVQFARPGGGKA